jgi:DNA-binding NtrC family response regulator
MTKKSAVGRVLIVDDEALIRWTVTEMLNDRGYLVSEAADAGGALRAIQAMVDADDRFDIILLDYRLPDSADLGLLEKVKRLTPQTQVIMVTAHGAPELAERATALGAYAVAGKPFEVEGLSALVGRALAAGPATSR